MKRTSTLNSGDGNGSTGQVPNGHRSSVYLVSAQKRDPTHFETTELMRALHASGKAILTRGFELLFFLCFHDSSTKEVDIAALREKSEAHKSVANTRFARLLRVLSHAPAYRQLYKSEESAPNGSDSQSSTNPFLNAAHLLSIPSELTKEISSNNFVEYCDHNDSGIYDAFRKNLGFYDACLEMLAILYEISSIVLLCEEIFLIADTDGDPLLNKEANENIRKFFESFEKLCLSLSRTQKKLVSIALNQKQILDLNSGNQSPADQSWLSNYLRFGSAQNQLDRALRSCIDNIKLAAGKAERVALDDSQDKPKPNTSNLTKAIKIHCEHMHIFLEANNLLTPQNGRSHVRKKSAEIIELFGIQKPTQQIRLLDDNSLSQLQDQLAKKPYANEIHLQKNNLTGIGGAQLCAKLSRHQPLKMLVLSGNVHLFDTIEATPENMRLGLVEYSSAKAFSDLLRNHRALTQLRIDSCGITDVVAIILSDGLSENMGLEFLDAGANNIGDEGIEKLCEALKRHRKLHTLHINGNSILQTGGEAILALVSQENSCIRMIDISDNKIPPALAEKITDRVKSNAKKFEAMNGSSYLGQYNC